MNGSLFEPAIFWKVLAVTQALAIVGLAVVFLTHGSVAVHDVVGTFISATIVAYMAHLWIARSLEE